MIMDISYLVQPLDSAHGPCGEDMTFSAEFDEIQEARRFDDPSIAQGEWITEIKEANWAQVVRIGEALLAEKTKDLRVAAWLVEARGKLAGLAGLADGYAVLYRLSDSLWDTLHPLPEDGDFEQRAGVLDWLLNQTSRLIREIPLTASSKGRFSLIDCEVARNAAKNVERNPGLAEALVQNGTVSLEQIDAAAKNTPIAHFAARLQEAERLKAEMAAVQALFNDRLGDHAPSFGASFDALDDARRFLQRHTGNGTPVAAEAPGTPANQADGAETPAIEGSGAVRTRAQAIHQLREIAEYFRRTEPHSPVAYLADKAARWGSMSLHEWLRTVVKDDGALHRVEELLGVAPDHK